MRFIAACLVVSLVAGCASSKPKPTPTEDPEASDAPPPPASPTVAPRPTGRGVVATIIYVTEIGVKEKKRPGAVIFSSDSSSPYLQERPRPSRILKPVEDARMAELLANLKQAGLDRLTPQAQKIDDAITPDRQFIIIRDDTRVTYRRDTSDLRTFTSCEKVLVDASHERDEYIETQGREATSDFKPLNPGR